MEYAKDPVSAGSVLSQKRSELLHPVSINEAINQHFKESLRNVQPKVIYNVRDSLWSSSNLLTKH